MKHTPQHINLTGLDIQETGGGGCSSGVYKGPIRPLQPPSAVSDRRPQVIRENKQ